MLGWTCKNGDDAILGRWHEPRVEYLGGDVRIFGLWIESAPEGPGSGMKTGMIILGSLNQTELQ